MGMYDSFHFKCPFCKNDSYAQTKLGEKALDHWKIGEVTTIKPGQYRSNEDCDNCKQYPIFVIDEDYIFSEILTEPTDLNARQEMPYGPLAPIGSDPKEQIQAIADELKEVFKNLDLNEKED